MTDTLVLVDGNSLVHRAFHALPLLTSSSTGEVTNAAYGFSMMLLKAIDDLRPSHAAVAFDTPKPTFRHLQFEAYKATRPPTPDGLAPQFGRVVEILEALHIPIYRLDGIEADDVLGTLATQAVAQGFEVVIITGDTDALQLVGPQVRVLVPRRGVTDTVLYDEAAVRERYGLEPAQLVDLRGLRGDTSDNIPGVPGIGEKTASKLLAEYGDVEGILANLGSLPGKQAELLRAHADQVRTSRNLAMILRDAPVTLDPDDCRLGPPDRERILALFYELDFRSLIERLPGATQADQLVARKAAPRASATVQQAGLFDEPRPVAVNTEPPGDGHVVASVAELEERVARLQDVGETVGLIALLSRADPMRADLLGITLYSRQAGAAYVPFAGASDGGEPLPFAASLDALRPLLEDVGIPKASPNGKPTMIALARQGVVLRGLSFDSGLAAYLVEASQRTPSLQDLSWSRLKRELPGMKSVTGDGRAAAALDAVSVGQMGAHLCREAETLGQLEPILRRELADSDLESLYADVELPLVAVLADMEMDGISVDVPYLKELSRELYDRVAGLETAIFEAVGHDFNINSPQQLATVLFDELKLPGAKRTSTGRASTAADVLSGLKGAHPAIDLVLEHRELTKLKSTYVDALPLLVHPETGRIHSTFNQTVAATGRLSSADPNVQNIPVRTELGRRVRRAFVSRGPGWKLLSADYSQIELRIEAHITQDPTLLEAFRQGEDVHAATAAELFGVGIDQVTSDMRRVAKTANFAIIYGVSPFGFAEQTGLSQHEAAEFIRRYFEKFSGVNAFQKRLIKEARESGTVMTLLGRRRTIPELKSPVYAVRAAGERMAINAPVQGTASDIIKIAMVRIHQHLIDQKLRGRLLLQVHDELMFEVPDDEVEAVGSAAKEIMEGAMELSVPLIVDLRSAENWGAMY